METHIAYEVAGDPEAPPMVLLHALGERGRDWAPVLPALAARFRVYVPDLRGHGDSGRPGEYSFELMRDDVIGLLDDLGLDTVTLVGHSMGGAVAYLVAMQHPGRVSRLIVEDAPPPYPRARPVPDRPEGPIDFDWAVVPAIVGQVNAGDPAILHGLGFITAPTLLIGGGSTSHVPQDRLAEAAARIPSCDLVTIAAGHNVHAGRPAEFARTVLDWLSVVDSRTGPVARLRGE